METISCDPMLCGPITELMGQVVLLSSSVHRLDAHMVKQIQSLEGLVTRLDDFHKLYHGNGSSGIKDDLSILKKQSIFQEGRLLTLEEKSDVLNKLNVEVEKFETAKKWGSRVLFTAVGLILLNGFSFLWQLYQILQKHGLLVTP